MLPLFYSWSLNKILLICFGCNLAFAISLLHEIPQGDSNLHILVPQKFPIYEALQHLCHGHILAVAVLSLCKQLLVIVCNGVMSGFLLYMSWCVWCSGCLLMPSCVCSLFSSRAHPCNFFIIIIFLNGSSVGYHSNAGKACHIWLLVLLSVNNSHAKTHRYRNWSFQCLPIYVGLILRFHYGCSHRVTEQSQVYWM